MVVWIHIAAVKPPPVTCGSTWGCPRTSSWRWPLPIFVVEVTVCHVAVGRAVAWRRCPTASARISSTLSSLRRSGYMLISSEITRWRWNSILESRTQRNQAKYLDLKLRIIRWLLLTHACMEWVMRAWVSTCSPMRWADSVVPVLWVLLTVGDQERRCISKKERVKSIESYRPPPAAAVQLKRIS